LNTAPGVASASSNSSVATFTIIESDAGPYEGMNGSALHMSTPWPVMTVHKGQEVVIHIYNCASSEAHGFAIDYYFNLGVTVHEGQSFVETFLATMAGNFTVYCNVFCAIHPLMQNGRLTVLS
jgi:nitrous oxide reductase